MGPYCYGANNPIRYIDIEGYVIGDPNDPLTKRVQASLNKTETGRALWKSLETNKRVFYFHGITVKSSEAWNKALASHQENGTRGEAVPKVIFEKYKEGDYTDVSKNYDTYNAKTGKYDKTSAWDETHLLIYLEGIKQLSLDNMLKNSIGTAINAETDQEVLFGETVAHESEHGLQDSEDWSITRYDPIKHIFKIIGKEDKDYSKRQHEKDAKDVGEKVKVEQQFLKNHPEKDHPGSAGPPRNSGPIEK